VRQLTCVDPCSGTWSNASQGQPSILQRDENARPPLLLLLPLPARECRENECRQKHLDEGPIILQSSCCAGLCHDTITFVFVLPREATADDESTDIGTRTRS
jgi:hypothetical protein